MNNSAYSLPIPIKWSVGNNPYVNPEKPHQLQLQIPVDSIPSLCEHLMSLEEQKWSHHNAYIYDYQRGEKLPKPVVYIRASGRDGLWGTMNPRKLSGAYPSQLSQSEE